MTKRAPAFQFYARDFLADANVQAMTLEQRGAYIWLLSHCWMEGRLSGDLRGLARICGISFVAFKKIWSAIEPRFTKHSDGTYSHKRLEVERKKQADYIAKQSAKGKKRWELRDTPDDTASLLAEADRTLEEADRALDENTNGIAAAKPRLNRNDALHLQTTSVLPPTPLAPDSRLTSRARVDWFDRIYVAYPNKAGKFDGEVAFAELEPSEETAAVILADVQERVRAGWARYERRFIQQLKAYINKRMWTEVGTHAAPEPFDTHAHAWQCSRCGAMHEGKREQVGTCLAAAKAS